MFYQGSLIEKESQHKLLFILNTNDSIDLANDLNLRLVEQNYTYLNDDNFFIKTTTNLELLCAFTFSNFFLKNAVLCQTPHRNVSYA